MEANDVLVLVFFGSLLSSCLLPAFFLLGALLPPLSASKAFEVFDDVTNCLEFFYRTSYVEGESDSGGLERNNGGVLLAPPL